MIDQAPIVNEPVMTVGSPPAEGIDPADVLPILVTALAHDPRWRWRYPREETYARAFPEVMLHAARAANRELSTRIDAPQSARWPRRQAPCTTAVVHLRRIHQEDLCQAFSAHPESKYQHDGGRSPEDIAALHSDPPVRLIGRVTDHAGRCRTSIPCHLAR